MNQRLLCSLLVFILVFVLFGFAVDTIWFREDDLGTILGGIIRNWHDAIRVFSSDCRSFITPVNYQRTAPNVISGFLRPMQNVFFSVVYFFWGTDAYAYYLLHIACHAANAAVFCFLLSSWLPISLSCSAGFMLAFYPSVSWLTWIGTLQNSLAVLFLLLAVVVFRRMNGPALMAGVLFLASLISRETTMLLPLWFLLGAYWFGPPLVVRSEASCRASRTIALTWPLFAAGIVYIAMRLASFGVATLPRTLRNVSIRFPWFTQFFKTHVSVTSTAVTALAPAVPAATAPVASASTHGDLHATLLRIAHDVLTRLAGWLDSLFNLPPLGGQHQQLLLLTMATLLVTFLWCAYRGQRRLMLWLSFGLLCALWPGVVAYPNPRYLNVAYPFVVTLVVVGVYLAWQQRTRLLRVAAGLVLAGALVLTVTNARNNRRGLHDAGVGSYVYKQRFADFFARYRFPAHAQFVVLSSPYVSDIQHVFQAFLGNLDTVLVFDPFCTLAERGVMGCCGDYRTVGVGSRIAIESLALSAGQSPAYRRVRLTSSDSTHCGWWLRHSDHPIRWVAQTRSYEWTTQQYRPGRWYPCSIGKFFIHTMTSDDCVIDITFAIDPCWITPDTIFVAWNTTTGCYEVVER